MKQFSIILLCLFISTNISFAQEDSIKVSESFKHHIGVTAGFTIGNGLSYRHSFNKFEIQGSFSPYKEAGRSRYSAGVTFIYKLVEAPKVKFFIYQGNQYIYRKDYEETWDHKASRYLMDNIEESYVNNGIGIGVRIIILKRLGWDIMGGYASYNNYTSISFTGETGLFFMF